MLKTALQNKLTQNVAMTPRLQMAVKMLQMSSIELSSFLQKEMEENPLLNDSDPDESGVLDSFESYQTYDSDAPETLIFEDSKEFDPTFTPPIKTEKSLGEFLHEQWHTMAENELEYNLGDYLIDNVTPEGFLDIDPQEISTRLKIPLSTINRTIEKMQKMEPTGVLARSLSECFALQLAEKAMLTDKLQTFLEHLPKMANVNIASVAKLCKQSIDEIREHLKIIRTLDPKPGLQFSSIHNPIVIPDVFIRNHREHIYAELNPDAFPNVFVNSDYYQELKNCCKKNGDLHFLTSKMNHANWLVNAVEQRAASILKVATSIIKFQSGFFENGIRFLKPLSLKEVAEDAQLHESTVSRITTNKHLATPLGNFDLKFFFSSKLQSHTNIKNQNTDEVSSKHVMNIIKSLIHEEESKNPLSDDNVAILLQNQGINIARRTVAKYRTILNIPSSSRRRYQI